MEFLRALKVTTAFLNIWMDYVPNNTPNIRQDNSNLTFVCPLCHIKEKILQLPRDFFIYTKVQHGLRINKVLLFARTYQGFKSKQIS